MVADFPPRPLRDIAVRHVRQAGCPSYVAFATLDFEPSADGAAGYAFVNVLPDETLPWEYAAALDEGVRLELAESCAHLTVGVRVVVRAARVHEVDSNETAFRRAGRLAVQEALRRVSGGVSGGVSG
ncbi:hypothetical protein NLX86_08700 [Streptomyces sp. A3M-1-3]|uniref:hypothetical protein n=1 Tax=Streptomyces sp. A3M-1-3 TaxID=2962044 RepID=UPI0020B72662|nr:hypothetical protein [Streptomyces sp. A3M-1-3]MCP3818189.1 hypothetical protein [Streptomyces sp. A3M-1-3]